MAKCLVVGGNGFLGSWLVDALVDQGHEVSVFDRFSSGQSYISTGVRAIVGDFMNHAHVRAALSGQEYLFHFLSATTPATAEDDPTIDIRTNIASSVELLEFAVEAGISRVFFASTGGAIYGEQAPGSISELALPAPISPYAIGKLAIEGYLRYFQKKHGLNSVAFRISNPYGPRQKSNNKQGVIPIFLNNLAAGRSVVQYGDGSMVRDFIYVEDAAKLLANVVNYEPRHPVYNIGSGEGHTIAELIGVISQVTEVELDVQVVPQPSTFVDRVVLDTSRYRAEFGEQQFVPLSEGIRRTWLETAGKRA